MLGREKREIPKLTQNVLNLTRNAEKIRDIVETLRRQNVELENKVRDERTLAMKECLCECVDA